MRLLVLLLSIVLASCSSESPPPKGQKEHMEAPAMPKPAPAQIPRPAPAAKPAPAAQAMPRKEMDAAQAPRSERRNTELAIRTKPRATADLEGQELANQIAHKANLVFAIPESAHRREPIDAQLIVDIGREVELLLKDLTVSGKVTQGQFNSSRIILAKLYAPDFEILSQSQAEQVIINGRPAVWNWSMAAKTGCKCKVVLDVYTMVRINGVLEPNPIKKFTKTINVHVSNSERIVDWINDHLEGMVGWLWTGAVVPLAIFWYQRRRKKKS